MWSLSRVIASLDTEFDCHNPAIVNAFFKLPVFMPSTLALGYKPKFKKKLRQTLVDFEIRDEKDKRPHLQGQLIKMDQE